MCVAEWEREEGARGDEGTHPFVAKKVALKGSGPCPILGEGKGALPRPGPHVELLLHELSQEFFRFNERNLDVAVGVAVCKQLGLDVAREVGKKGS